MDLDAREAINRRILNGLELRKKQKALQSQPMIRMRQRGVAGGIGLSMTSTHPLTLSKKIVETKLTTECLLAPSMDEMILGTLVMAALVHLPAKYTVTNSICTPWISKNCLYVQMLPPRCLATSYTCTASARRKLRRATNNSIHSTGQNNSP